MLTLRTLDAARVVGARLLRHCCILTETEVPSPLAAETASRPIILTEWQLRKPNKPKSTVRYWSVEERNCTAIREHAYRIAQNYGWTLKEGRIDGK